MHSPCGQADDDLRGVQASKLAGFEAKSRHTGGLGGPYSTLGNPTSSRDYDHAGRAGDSACDRVDGNLEENSSGTRMLSTHHLSRPETGLVLAVLL